MLQLCCVRGYPSLAMNAKPARSDAYVSNTMLYFGTHVRPSIFELTASSGARPDSLQCNNCLVSHINISSIHLLYYRILKLIDYIQRRDQTCHFSHTKRKLKVKDTEDSFSRSSASLSNWYPKDIPAGADNLR